VRIECSEVAIARIFLRAIQKLGFRVHLELTDGRQASGYIRSITHNALYFRGADNYSVPLDQITLVIVHDTALSRFLPK
jgi:hypothetical protein